MLSWYFQINEERIEKETRIKKIRNCVTKIVAADLQMISMTMKNKYFVLMKITQNLNSWTTMLKHIQNKNS